VNVMDWRFLVTIISTVTFGILALILALKLARKRQPVWAYKTTKKIGLGSNMPPELKLTFNEQPVSDVYQTRFILFNKGNEAILKENITETIAIHFKGANILRQPSILAMSRKGIELSSKQVVKDGDNAIEVSFKYLDHNDGAVIEVWHTTSQDIKISGNIIGASQIRYIGGFAPTVAGPLYNSLVPVVGPAVFIGVFLGIAVKQGTLGQTGDIAFLAIFSAAFVFGLVPFIRCRKFPRWSVIKS
jgi:hypothetical protein